MPDRYADMATTIAHLIEPLVGTGRAGITIPANLTGLLPYARATRTGGPRDRLNDRARINIDILDTDYARGSALAEAIDAYLMPGRRHQGHVVIDRVEIDQAPREVDPWAPGIFRWEARYTIVSRRHRVA